MQRQVWLGLGAAVLVCAAVVPFVLRTGPADPTAKARRTLAITSARVTPSGEALEIKGSTNLVDGSRLRLILRSGSSELLQREAVADGGVFELTEHAQGTLAAGHYTLEVRFDLAAQPQEVAKALDYQPKSISDRAELDVQARNLPAEAPRGEVLALIDRVSQAGPEELSGLDEAAKALDASLWIAEEKAALHTLRLAINEAQKAQPDRSAFERLLLKAHAQAGKAR